MHVPDTRPLASLQSIRPMLSVTEPVPVPRSVTEIENVGTMEAKVTCSVAVPLTVTLQAEVPVHVLQPVKLLAGLGVAVRIATAPFWYVPVHVPLATPEVIVQLICPRSSVTVPLPVPVPVIRKVEEAGL